MKLGEMRRGEVEEVRENEGRERREVKVGQVREVRGTKGRVSRRIEGKCWKRN